MYYPGCSTRRLYCAMFPFIVVKFVAIIKETVCFKCFKIFFWCNYFWTFRVNCRLLLLYSAMTQKCLEQQQQQHYHHHQVEKHCVLQSNLLQQKIDIYRIIIHIIITLVKTVQCNLILIGQKEKEFLKFLPFFGRLQRSCSYIYVLSSFIICIYFLILRYILACIYRIVG